ncbi:MAG: helix-turn-helix domain-containing protein [Proteobacteria bacterium]|nr:helix-turn-helix domain-containing protein [Pseudomonadota bacterium]MBU4009791.1 helix-turn-helix domain-containing protein [Pseudomonadota bacterium]MBU4036273.1 helix-turn-helix domain-containing protein [Pseudomonadota bacterium]
MANQELLTIEEMAQRLKVPKSWLYTRTRIKGGDFPVIRVGKYCRFDVAEVMAFIKKESEKDLKA